MRPTPESLTVIGACFPRRRNAARSLMTLQSTSYKSPVGNLHIITRDQTLLALNLSSMHSAIASLGATRLEEKIEKSLKISWISKVLDDYFDGDLTIINKVRVEQAGSDFSSEVWKCIRKVRAGKVATYAELAEMVGSPRAVRAAGTACGRNKIAIVIPCHRIVKSDGTIGNYGYGIPTKKLLLAHEGIDY